MFKNDYLQYSGRKESNFKQKKKKKRGEEKSIKQLWASSKMSSIFHSVWIFKPTIEQYNQVADSAYTQPVFLNCVGQIPKGPFGLLLLPGITARGNISWPQLGPAEAQALSAKGQQPACNQYAKTLPQIHNGVHEQTVKVICSTCAPTNTFEASRRQFCCLVEIQSEMSKWRAADTKEKGAWLCLSQRKSEADRGFVFSTDTCVPLEGVSKECRKELRKYFVFHSFLWNYRKQHIRR